MSTAIGKRNPEQRQLPYFVFSGAHVTVSNLSTVKANLTTAMEIIGDLQRNQTQRLACARGVGKAATNS